MTSISPKIYRDEFLDLWSAFIWDCNLLVSLDDDDPQLNDICDALESTAIELKQLID